jgi:hypothetical protein
VGILSYIKDKKEEFNEVKERYQNKRMKHNEEEGARLNNERLKIEQRNQASNEYKKEKLKLQEARKESFNNSAVGGAIKGISEFVKDHKAKGSSRGAGFQGFGSNTTAPTVKTNKQSFGLGGSNPFGANFGSQNNAPTIKKKKSKRETVIIIRR